MWKKSSTSSNNLINFLPLISNDYICSSHHQISFMFASNTCSFRVPISMHVRIWTQLLVITNFRSTSCSVRLLWRWIRPIISDNIVRRSIGRLLLSNKKICKLNKVVACSRAQEIAARIRRAYIYELTMQLVVSDTLRDQPRALSAFVPCVIDLTQKMLFVRATMWADSKNWTIFFNIRNVYVRVFIGITHQFYI